MYGIKKYTSLVMTDVYRIYVEPPTGFELMFIVPLFRAFFRLVLVINIVILSSLPLTLPTFYTTDFCLSIFKIKKEPFIFGSALCSCNPYNCNLYKKGETLINKCFVYIVP